MKEQSILRCVLSAIIVSGTFGFGISANAQSYCSGFYCSVTVPYPPGWNGGGVGGFLANDGNSGTSHFATLPSQADLCNAYLTSWPEGCNRSSPPPLIVNGCGAAGGIPIPDSLVVLDDTYDGSHAAEAASFGNVFTAACNLHDQCYGKFTGDNTKLQCDAKLEQDMIDSARAMIPSNRWATFEINVKVQAYAYSKGLAWGPIAMIASGPAYAAAQKEAECRFYSESTNLLNC